MVAESEESAKFAAEVGSGTRGAQSATQMANELSNEIGKNSVSYTTPNKTGHIDLKGKSHFDKSTSQSIPTPHVKGYFIPSRGVVAVNTGIQTTRPATKQDVRTARRIIEHRH
jgi:hypothetical protein